MGTTGGGLREKLVVNLTVDRPDRSWDEDRRVGPVGLRLLTVCPLRPFTDVPSSVQVSVHCLFRRVSLPSSFAHSLSLSSQSPCLQAPRLCLSFVIFVSPIHPLVSLDLCLCLVYLVSVSMYTSSFSPVSSSSLILSFHFKPDHPTPRTT